MRYEALNITVPIVLMAFITVINLQRGKCAQTGFLSVIVIVN